MVIDSRLGKIIADNRYGKYRNNFKNVIDYRDKNLRHLFLIR